MLETDFTRRLKGVIEEAAERVLLRLIRSRQGLIAMHRHGEVTAVSGGVVKVKWDGETAATEALYPCLESYTTPAIGHRVYAVPSGNTWLVLGRMRTS